MMITKETFVKLITMIMNTIDDKREFIEDNDYIPDECKDCIMEECDFLKDLITMLTVVTFDRFGVIRDYLYERDENDEYFFGIPKGNKIEVYLLTSAEELYDYLALQIVDGMLREVFRGYHKTKNSALKRACPDAASSFH